MLKVLRSFLTTNVLIQRCFSKIKTNLLKSLILYHQKYFENGAMRCDLPFEKFQE